MTPAPVSEPVAPPAATPIPTPAPVQAPPVIVAPPVAAVKSISTLEAQTLVGKLLPAKISERNGWKNDLVDAFTTLKIPYTPEYFCAVMAVIEQESSWQGDPPVPGLGKIVWKQVEEKAGKYHIPLIAVQTALLKSSPDGRSYKERIDKLQTEAQMNAVFEDLANDAKRLSLPFNMSNPIRTGGPMQVSVEFAEGHVRAWPYPYARRSSVRNEVFTRKGGVYFGTAILLQYPAPYSKMIYRFADFNAGRYASRNAAFQAAVNKLSGEEMDLDGDLLRYERGYPMIQSSGTEKALQKLGKRLNLSNEEIRRDLLLEKVTGFGQTTLYQRVFNLAGNPSREVMPQIDLHSPKITRKLTTEWFAKRVDGRYQTCLNRAPAI
ncbi:uncharacterized protein DUF1615 [Iodobacter fluviatilis]|uniref:Protein of uncharacterized function (DUF1615) n=2 Tax=Iodobacter fluviatilis TaxID=537 RepID=A0A377Q8H3_9NEIS|nr:uncharacterized protein DUF1615 [Iodobacter fluviatilis]STQ91008.1 Protein of uncharacterised function (DUF1615) [Iodobacter fluviatilis]